MSDAIEWNRMALKRIVAELVDLAGLAEGDRQSAIGNGQSGTQGGVPAARDASAQKPAPDCRLPTAATIPRLLWRTILRVLRPAEAATRRLIIAASRGIAVPVPRLARPKPKPQSMVPLMRQYGLAVSYRFAAAEERRVNNGRAKAKAAGRARAKGANPSPDRIPAFRLFDPRRRLMLGGPRRRTVPPHAAPRICVPGYSELRPLPKPPSPNDPIDVARLVQRLAALTAALDDLPGQAMRFAKWRARRDAITAREKEEAASGKQDASRAPARHRRTWPLRLGRPYGGRLLRYDPDGPRRRNIREVDEILAHCHSLARYALQYPDTS